MKRIHASLVMMLLLHSVIVPGCVSYQSPSPTTQQPPVPVPVLSDLDQGLKLIDEKDYAGGRAKLEEALESTPTNAKGWYKLGRLYLGYYWDPNRAIECGELAVKYDPNNADYHEFLGEAYGRMAQRSGRNLKALRLARKSKAEFTKALELQPDYLWARRALLEYLTQAPKIAGGSWDAAKRLAEETLSIHEATGYVMLASLHRKKGEKEKAEEFYLKAIEIDPRNPSWHNELGWFYFGQKRHDETRVHLQKYQELKPHDPSASLNLGWFYILIGEFIEGEAHIRKAVESQPRYVEAWYRLGDLYERKGKKEQAQSAFQKCTALDGDNRWTGTAKERKEERKKKEQRKKRKKANLQQYTVVGVLQSQQKKDKNGKILSVYVVKDANNILFRLPVKGKEAEEYIGRKVKVVGEGVEKPDKKGGKKVIFKEISSFEEVE